MCMLWLISYHSLLLVVLLQTAVSYLNTQGGRLRQQGSRDTRMYCQLSGQVRSLILLSSQCSLMVLEFRVLILESITILLAGSWILHSKVVLYEIHVCEGNEMIAEMSKKLIKLSEVLVLNSVVAIALPTVVSPPPRKKKNLQESTVWVSYFANEVYFTIKKNISLIFLVYSLRHSKSLIELACSKVELRHETAIVKGKRVYVETEAKVNWNGSCFSEAEKVCFF